MKKLLFAMLALVLAISMVGSAAAKPSANSTFFTDGFESGDPNFLAWSNMHGFVENVSIYSGYPLCDIIQQAGTRCADAFYHVVGTVDTAQYLENELIADPLSDALITAWTIQLDTNVTTAVYIFKLFSQDGTLLMGVQARINGNGNTQARLVCRDKDISGNRVSVWKNIPDTLGREAYANITPQWYRGTAGSPTDPGLCTLGMNDLITGVGNQVYIEANTSTFRIDRYQVGGISGGQNDSETEHDFDEFLAITE